MIDVAQDIEADESEITSTIDSPYSYRLQYGPWRPVINRLSVTKTANHPFAFRLFQYHSNLTMVLSSIVSNTSALPQHLIDYHSYHPYGPREIFSPSFSKTFLPSSPLT